MSDKASAPRASRTYRSGFVINRSHARVIAQYDALTDQGEPDSVLMEWTGDSSRWRRVQHVEWTAIRLWVQSAPEFTSYTLGLSGDVAIEDASGRVNEEQVDGSVHGPRGSGDLRDLRMLGLDLIACGMHRRVYRRAGARTWIPEDAGVVQSSDDISVRGLNAIDGPGLDSATAVGFAGEVWRRTGGLWRSVPSPTNLVLHRVRAVGPDRWVACGQAGVILLGVGDTCVTFDDGQIGTDIWGLEVFADAVWLATDLALFRLEDRRTLRRVDTGLDDGWTYRHLHSMDGVLWSFGPRHIAWTRDGIQWVNATP